MKRKYNSSKAPLSFYTVDGFTKQGRRWKEPRWLQWIVVLFILWVFYLGYTN